MTTDSTGRKLKSAADILGACVNLFITGQMDTHMQLGLLDGASRSLAKMPLLDVLCACQSAEHLFAAGVLLERAKARALPKSKDRRTILSNFFAVAGKGVADVHFGAVRVILERAYGNTDSDPAARRKLLTESWVVAESASKAGCAQANPNEDALSLARLISRWSHAFYPSGSPARLKAGQRLVGLKEYLRRPAASAGQPAVGQDPDMFLLP